MSFTLQDINSCQPHDLGYEWTHWDRCWVTPWAQGGSGLGILGRCARMGYLQAVSQQSELLGFPCGLRNTLGSSSFCFSAAEWPSFPCCPQPLEACSGTSVWCYSSGTFASKSKGACGAPEGNICPPLFWFLQAVSNPLWTLPLSYRTTL